MRISSGIFRSISADFSHAFRQLRKSPGFSLSVIVTLAIGIGASAAMFTVVDQVLLRRLPYPEPQQLVQIKESGKNGPARWGAPFPDIKEWHERSRTLSSIAFHTNDEPTSFLEGNSGPVQVNTPRVSANLFSTLEVQPAMGRGFNDSADSFENNGDRNTAILSDTVWRDGFGADPNILGKVIKVNGSSYTIIGVMPRGFQFPFNPEKPQIWIPIALGESDQTRAKNAAHEYRIIARLRNDVDANAATAELKVIQADVAKQYTDPTARENATSVEVQLYSDTVVAGDIKKGLLALLAASGLLWLIACVNVTSLMLARAAVRQREIAVRAALGASNWRIMRQLGIEGLLLSVAASLVGAGLIIAGLGLFARELAIGFNIQLTITPNPILIFVLVGLTVVSAVISSLWPSLVATKAPITPLLKEGGLQGGGRHQLARRVLVLSQVAMSLALLTCCGLLLRTIFALRQVPLGFKTDHVIVADMVIPAYKFDQRNMTTELYQPLVERVEQMPGVQAASLTTAVPLGKRFPILLSFAPDEHDPESARIENLVVQFRAVGPGLQRVLGFRMLAGRFFNEGDTPGSEPVVVVNRAFVKEYFGGKRDPKGTIGEELLSYDKHKLAHIVGVIDDERQASIMEPSRPEVDVCIPQITPKSGFYQVAEGLAMNLAVRTERAPSAFIPELRAALRNARPELAGSTFTTMDQVVDDSYGNQRIAALLLQIFSGSALLLCVAGLYSLLAYLVTQRTREMGIRFALGAQRRQVIWLVMRQAVQILVVGSAAGLVASYFATRMLATLIFGVKPYDGLTLGAASVLLVAIGLGAACIPARRAARINPTEALRAE
ncbi:MAG TPA: ABC transporter permease [Terriglobales bacterium]|jgi:predicted permease